MAAFGNSVGEFKLMGVHSGNELFIRSIIVCDFSIAINGVSLTVFNVSRSSFRVTIIPYTFDHTNFNALQVAQSVNLEFDILGKYFLRKMELQS